MNKVTQIAVTLVVILITMSSCSEYSKIVKGSDYPLKYKTALKLYDEGECYKSLTLLEELMTYYRLSEKSENVYYYYAKTHYCLKEYYLASYYFKRFTKKFPSSNRVEECAYMTALCTKENSPEYNLDPSETTKAIDAFQLFMDRYPNSEKVDTCNFMIKELRGKLEKKSYEQAKLYYKMERYNSAVIAFQNTLDKFPDTQYREELMYLKVKAGYLLADNSVPKKKEERYGNVIESYRIFANYFSGSKYLKSATKYFEDSENQLSKIKEKKQ